MKKYNIKLDLLIFVFFYLKLKIRMSVIETFKVKTKKIQEKDWENKLYKLVGNPLDIKDFNYVRDLYTKFKNIESSFVKNLQLLDNNITIINGKKSNFCDEIKLLFLNLKLSPNKPLCFSDPKKIIDSEWYKMISLIFNELSELDSQYYFIKYPFDIEIYSKISSMFEDNLKEITFLQEYIFLTEEYNDQISTFKVKSFDDVKELIYILKQLYQDVTNLTNILFTPQYNVRKYIIEHQNIINDYFNKSNVQEKEALINILEAFTNNLYKFKLMDKDKELDVLEVTLSLINQGNDILNNDSYTSQLISLLSNMEVPDELDNQDLDPKIKSKLAFINNTKKVFNELQRKVPTTTEELTDILNKLSSIEEVKLNDNSIIENITDIVINNPDYEVDNINSTNS